MTEHNRSVVRTFDVEFFDGTIETFQSYGFPWIFREWFCVQDLDGKKHYHPAKNVRSWEQVSDEVAAA